MYAPFNPDPPAAPGAPTLTRSKELSVICKDCDKVIIMSALEGKIALGDISLLDSDQLPAT